MVLPSITLLNWKPTNTPQPDSVTAWNGIYNNIKVHEENHVRDDLQFFKKSFWKEWSQEKYVIRVCFAGQSYTSAEGKTVTAEACANALVKDLQERYLIEYGNRLLFDAAMENVTTTEITASMIGGILGELFVLVRAQEFGERFATFVDENGVQTIIQIIGWGAVVLEPLNNDTKL